MANESIFKFYTGIKPVENLFIKLANEVPHKKDGVSDFEELQNRAKRIEKEFKQFGYTDDESLREAIAIQIIQHRVLNHSLGD